MGRRNQLALLFGGGLLLTVAPATRAVTGAEYRRMADDAVAHRQFARAADNYRKEAAVYRQKGDPGGAAVEEKKAERWTTRVQLYVDTPFDRSRLNSLSTHAKYEPLYGCYVGAYVMNDDRLRAERKTGGPEANAVTFGDLTGKPMATVFDYCEYGTPFPLEWARALSSEHIAAHIALEPNSGLDVVKDDVYLQQFARDAASCDGPVFLRFASEMNGDWTAYHKDPALYREKFRLVHDVMARLAPNVAMIWCVNNIPEENMDDYYPGDDAVDWVGVNFYSVMHHDNNPARPAEFEHPTAMLDTVYQKYSSRKPIAICEYGASHRERLASEQDRSDFASTKIAELFVALPRQYPRVKLIDLFDLNCLTAHVMPGRQLNDYCVTDSAAVLKAVRQAMAPGYFLSRVGSDTYAPVWLQPLTQGSRIPLPAHLSAWVRSYEDNPILIYRLDGNEFSRIQKPGEYRAELGTESAKPGQHRLSLEAIDSNGARAGIQELDVLLEPALSAAPGRPVRTNLPPTLRRPSASTPPGPQEIMWVPSAPIGLAILGGMASVFVLVTLRLLRRLFKRKP